MKRRLSSILVPVYKLFPLLAAAALVISIPGAIANGPSKNFPLILLFFFIWGVIFYFATRRWKSVYLRGETLLVSNFLRRVEIPVSEVRAVEASSAAGWSPRRITIKLKSAAEFGEEIVFVPRGLGFTAGSQAKELRNLFKL